MAHAVLIASGSGGSSTNGSSWNSLCNTSIANLNNRVTDAFSAEIEPEV